MRKIIKRQRTIVARLGREIARKAQAAAQVHCERTKQALGKAVQIVAQSGQRKNAAGVPKLCAWHAPEVVCIWGTGAWMRSTPVLTSSIRARPSH